MRFYRSRRVLTEPAAYIENRRIEVDRKRERIISLQERSLAAKRRDFVHLASALDAMSPLRVLSRGYSIATGDSGLVRSVESLERGDVIDLRFTDGSAKCSVLEVNKYDSK